MLDKQDASTLTGLLVIRRNGVVVDVINTDPRKIPVAQTKTLLAVEGSQRAEVLGQPLTPETPIAVNAEYQPIFIKRGISCQTGGALAWS